MQSQWSCNYEMLLSPLSFVGWFLVLTGSSFCLPKGRDKHITTFLSITAQPYTLNNVHANSLLDYGDKKNQKQAIFIRYLPSLLIQFLCTVCTASCRM